MYLWALERAKTSKTPVYTYFFTQAIPWPEHPEFGAFHSGELPYVFRNFALMQHPFGPADFKTSDLISAYWKAFASTGDPNAGPLPRWPAVTGTSAETMEIGTHTGTIPAASEEKLQFWKAYFNSDLGKNGSMF